MGNWKFVRKLHENFFVNRIPNLRFGRRVRQDRTATFRFTFVHHFCGATPSIKTAQPRTQTFQLPALVTVSE